MAKKTQPNRSAGSASQQQQQQQKQLKHQDQMNQQHQLLLQQKQQQQQQQQKPSLPPPLSPPPSAPKSKTSGAAKKKNKKKAAQARQLDSINHLDQLNDNTDSNSAMGRSDMIGAYPTEDAVSITQRTTTGSMSPDEDDEDRITSHTMHPSLAAATRQTQEDLLATANDLYRQIESAAAAALATTQYPKNSNSPLSPSSHNSSNNNHQSGNSNSNGHLPHPDDDAYWTSLPAHLRSFIRSALPLAAGHSSSNNNQSQSSAQNQAAILPNLSSFAHAAGMVTSTTTSNQQSVPQLTSEQMAAAAEQLARVVQSHDWGRAVSTAAQQAGLSHSSVMNHIINGTARSSHNYSRDGSGGAATVSVTGGTVTGTIPLGSFTLPLPLHAHPDQHQHQNSHGLNEPVYYTGETTIVTSRIGDKRNGDDGLLDEDYYSDDARGMRGALNHTLLDGRHPHSEQASNGSNIGANNVSTTTGSKKKKKNKKKKSANASSNEAVPPPPVPSVETQNSTPTLIPNPAVSNKTPSPLNPSSRKPDPDPPGAHISNQSLLPNAAAPPSRLPPAPPSNQKKKSTITNSLSSNINNSASSSTITHTNSNNATHQPTERERIRVFWLTLNQEERANLVKIEKDAVLKKMKEQQRHSCSCAVCGRKRLAIEQELEVLYDAYYDELENYAEASKKYYGSDLKAKCEKGLPGAYPKPPGPGPFPGSVDIRMTTTQPPNPVSSKKAVPKPTRDHKNIRPRPQQAVPQQTHSTPQSNNASNGHYQQPAAAAKRNVPPPSQLKKVNSHNSNSDHDHTHSPNCPHHPHHHGPNHYHSNNRGKGVASTQSTPQPAHQRTQHHRNEDVIPDEDGEDEDEEEDYDDEEEEEYEEDEEEEGEFEDDDEIPALEEVPSETLVQNNAHKKPPVNGTNVSYPNKLASGDKANGAHVNNSDLFGFGNSLTVKGGILTVADDLLRNDGQKFLEMMESLADKRIQRERDAAENLLAGLEDDENDGDDYEEDEEDDDELDDDDGFDDEIITEEYRMKEGRRMFQIFAARMFEQRVLTAYREKVAQEKQAQLLRELEDEDRLAQERELKKVKDAQKKKEKKKAQKQQKDQDLAKKLKDKEAEEQAAKAAEEARLEAEKRKQEEQRIKREAQRKLQEAERAKKEEEKKKRLEEEARKRKEKEEKIRLEKEARIAKEKEEREKKTKEEAERKLKLEAERKEKEAREANAREELARRMQAEAAKREAEEVAKREAAKAAAAKLAAQNKNAPKPHQQRSPVSVRPPMTPKPFNNSAKVPPTSNAHNLPMPNAAFPLHTPNRQILPPPMLPRQMSVGIGLGRPASAAAAPPFSAAIPPMAGPSSYSNIPARPPSAQYSSSFPTSNAYPPPGGLQNLPPDMQVSINGIQTPLVGGPFMPIGNFQPPVGPMMPSINNRAFSGSVVPMTSQNHYVNPASPSQHPEQQQQRPSIASSISPSTTGIISPGLSSATSPLSALHLGSEPVRKASVSAVGPIGPSSSHIRRPSGLDESLIQGGFLSNSIEPIGRPKANGTPNVMELINGHSDQDSNSASVDASPTRTPQNVLGSSALLADNEAGANFPRRHTMPTNTTPTSLKTSGFQATSFDNGLVVGSSIWGTTLPAASGDSGWGSAVLSTPPPPVVTPRTPLQQSSLGGVVQASGMNPPRENTSDWIRRRAISAYCNMRLNEKWIPVGDVSIEMQRIHLDTLNVSLKDMVDACLIKRNIHNGGGDWQFSQQGPVLYTRWLPVSSQEASLGPSNSVSRND